MNGLKSIPNWILWTAALLAAALVFRFAMRGYAYIGYAGLHRRPDSLCITICHAARGAP